MPYFTHYSDHVGSRAGKHYKATLFDGEHLMIGLNCLEPGQDQPVHDHADADKVYVVLEGRGWFTVGDAQQEAGSGTVVFAPAGLPHGVENRASERLTLLVNIAPPPTSK
ncbi:MAG: cupin domain-containing protein [Anaerolineae bacterium]|nr:cupin domain-containing protein [Anaerolineae bacterium]